MKWFVVACFLLYLIRSHEGAVLKCAFGEQDTLCKIEKEEKDLPSSVQLAKEESDKEMPPFDAECSPGSEWNSNCHYCRCSDTGVAECLKEDMCDIEIIAEPIRCKPNSNFKRDCNTCVCLENGLGLCTLQSCPRSSVPKKSDLVFGKECAPGSQWKSQCNQCSCSPDGYSFCTEKGCIGQETEPLLRCAPDTVWRNECNTCRCTGDGRALCTKIRCVTNMPDAVLKPAASNVKEGAEANRRLEENKSESVVEDKQHIRKRSLCVPRQVFESGCNTCECSADGRSYRCTENECFERDVDKDVEVFIENEGVDHIERHSVCKPSGTFHIGCNTCICNAYGTDFSCTNKPCPLPKDVELFHELTDLRTSSETKTVVCVANKMFIMDCNTCWCNEDGTSYFCTRKVCVPDLPDEVANDDEKSELRTIVRECRPDEVFEMDCNMCRCMPDGKSFSCTRRACAEGSDELKKSTLSRKVRATPQEPPKTCQPGQEFRMDCNKCLCDNEGQDFSCTRIDCNALNNNNNGGARRKRDASQQQVSAECTPGSVFSRGCDVCRCTADGRHGTCTITRCTQNNTHGNGNGNGNGNEHGNEHGNENDNAPLPESEPSFRCNPGEQYKQDCNDCTCSADGRSVFCTLRLCDRDIVPSI